VFMLWRYVQRAKTEKVTKLQLPSLEVAPIAF